MTDVEVNHGMFAQGVEGIEAAGARLQHVQFVVRCPSFASAAGLHGNIEAITLLLTSLLR